MQLWRNEVLEFLGLRRPQCLPALRFRSGIFHACSQFLDKIVMLTYAETNSDGILGRPRARFGCDQRTERLLMPPLVLRKLTSGTSEAEAEYRLSQLEGTCGTRTSGCRIEKTLARACVSLVQSFRQHGSSSPVVRASSPGKHLT